MINTISFKNYKAFNKGEIKIKPITILLGANSVGKSSIIQLLLMLQQTALSDKYKSALRLHGEFVSLGENENIFKNKKIENDLEISFNFHNKNLYDLITEELHNNLISSFSGKTALLRSIFTENDNYHNNSMSLENKKNKIWSKKDPKSKTEFLENLSEYIKIFNQEKEFLKDVAHQGRRYTNHLVNIFDLKNETFDASSIGDLYDLIENLKQIKKKDFDITFRIKNIITKKKCFKNIFCEIKQ